MKNYLPWDSLFIAKVNTHYKYYQTCYTWSSEQALQKIYMDVLFPIFFVHYTQSKPTEVISH